MSTPNRSREKSANQIQRLSLRALNEYRTQIPTGRIVRRLGGFAVGDWERRRVLSDDGVETYIEAPIEMNANQVRAAIALLNKVMPDLQSVQMEVSQKDTEELSLDQLRARMRALLIGEAVDVQATDPLEDMLSLEGLDTADPLGDLLSL